MECVCGNQNQKCLAERQVGQTIMAASCDRHTLLSRKQEASHSRPPVLWASPSAKRITSPTLSPTQQEFFLRLLSQGLRNPHWNGFVQGHPASKDRAGLKLIKTSQFKPIWFPLRHHVSWERLCLSSQGLFPYTPCCRSLQTPAPQESSHPLLCIAHPPSLPAPAVSH